jgi:hypothetical protein
MTAAEDQNITISPIGDAAVVMTNNVQLNAQNDLRFADADSSNYVAFQSPETVASNVTWTLPNADGTTPGAGTSNQVLSTSGAGTLSWITPNVSLVDQTTSSSTHFVTLTTATTNSTITTLNRSSSKLTFQPSTGQLRVNALQVDGIANSLRTENNQTTSYTLQLADAGRVVRMNIASGSATVTVPNNSSVEFPVGTFLYILKTGAGTCTFAAAAGVTVSNTGTFGTNEEIYIRKRDTNEWIVTQFPIITTATGGTLTRPVGFNVHTYTPVGSASFVVAQ